MQSSGRRSPSELSDAQRVFFKLAEILNGHLDSDRLFACIFFTFFFFFSFNSVFYSGPQTPTWPGCDLNTEEDFLFSCPRYQPSPTKQPLKSRKAPRSEVRKGLRESSRTAPGLHVRGGMPHAVGSAEPSLQPRGKLTGMAPSPGRGQRSPAPGPTGWHGRLQLAPPAREPPPGFT